MLAVVTFVYDACGVSVFILLFFFLSDLSDMVYACLMGGAVSGFVVIVAVSMFVLLIFIGPWLSASNMKVLLFGNAAAAFIILFVLPLTTSIHLPSYCSLSFPCPPHCQLLLSSSYLPSLPWLCALDICLPFPF